MVSYRSNLSKEITRTQIFVGISSVLLRGRKEMPSFLGSTRQMGSFEAYVRLAETLHSG